MPEMIDVLNRLKEIAATKPELVKDAVENVEKTNPKEVKENAVESEIAIKTDERELTGSEEAKKEKLPDKKEISAEEKKIKSLRKQIQEKLLKFATRIPAFMYLTDFRENSLKDVITKLEPDLFERVTGLTVNDFDLIVTNDVFNTTLMNQAVYAFRRYEDASLRYTGIESHVDLKHYGLFDTVIGVEEKI